MTAVATMPVVALLHHLAEGAEEGALEHGVEDDERHADRLLEGDDQPDDEAEDHAAEPDRQQQAGALAGEHPRPGGHDEHDDEQAERLHDDVVEGQPTRLHGAGRRLLVEVLELVLRHVLGRAVLHGSLALREATVLGAALLGTETGVPLADLLVDLREHRVVSGHVSSKRRSGAPVRTPLHRIGRVSRHNSSLGAARAPF